MEQGALEGKGSLFKIADWRYKRSEDEDSPEAEGSQTALMGDSDAASLWGSTRLFWEWELTSVGDSR